MRPTSLKFNAFQQGAKHHPQDKLATSKVWFAWIDLCKSTVLQRIVARLRDEHRAGNERCLVLLIDLGSVGDAALNDPGVKLGVFSTGPEIRGTVWNLMTEIIATFVLVFVVLASGHWGDSATKTPGGLGWLGREVYFVITVSWIAPLHLSPDSDGVAALRMQRQRQLAELARLDAEVTRVDGELECAGAAGGVL